MSAVTKAMTMFNEGYPGKFSLGTKQHPDNPNEVPSMVIVWAHALEDFDEEIILTAALHLVTICKQWPPDLATMRDQCVMIASGELHAPTGMEACERVLMRHRGDESFELTALEKRAIKLVGTPTDIATNWKARSDFIKTFDTLVEQRRLERVTLPEVLALVERNRPALPEPKPRPTIKEPACQQAEQISELVNGLVDNKGI